MESINLNNYQSYFLDFAEGNLSAADSEKLSIFLKSNPHLQKELDEFEFIELREGLSTNKELKQELLRDEITGLKKVDYLMIAQAEGTISVEEKEELSLLVNESPQLINELAVYHQVKLVQDENIKYVDKQNLKQNKKGKLLWVPITSAAAAAIALFIVFNNLTNPREYSPQKLSLIQYENSDSSETIKSIFNKVKTKNKPISVKESNTHLAVNSTIEKPIRALGNRSTIPPIQILSFQELKSKKRGKEIKSSFESQLAENLKVKNTPAIEEFQPIDQFAINAFKSKLLDNKSVREALLDEIAALSNEKITYQKQANSNTKSRKITINIGKFGYSNF